MLGTRLVVARHRPGRTFVQLLISAALVVGGVYLAYVYGRAAISLEYAAARHERDEVQLDNAQLDKENNELRKRIAIIERAGQIDRKAYQDVDEYLLDLQSEIFSLKEEVAFYRGIVSSSGTKGLSIQSFDVQPEGDGAGYRYRLVLTQDMKSDKVVSGTVDMSIAGEQDGLTKRLSSQELRGGDSRRIEFQFKHFQKIEGTFSLPRGFLPHSVSVQITNDGETVTEKTFDWPGLTVEISGLGDGSL